MVGGSTGLIVSYLSLQIYHFEITESGIRWGIYYRHSLEFSGQANCACGEWVDGSEKYEGEETVNHLEWPPVRWYTYNCVMYIVNVHVRGSVGKVEGRETAKGIYINVVMGSITYPLPFCRKCCVKEEMHKGGSSSSRVESE